MNTENSKTNKSHRFRLDLKYKLNFKNPKKIWLQLISVFITHGRT